MCVHVGGSAALGLGPGRLFYLLPCLFQATLTNCSLPDPASEMLSPMVPRLVGRQVFDALLPGQSMWHRAQVTPLARAP